MAPTIKDVAQLSGLSTATVSKYINGISIKAENAMLIQQAIDKLHYKVNASARCLKTNMSKTIGVVVNTLLDVFSSRIITYLEKYLLIDGYNVIVCDCGLNDNHDAKRLNMLMERGVDGIVTFHEFLDSGELRDLLESKIPIVSIDHIQRQFQCDAVIVDNYSATRKVTQYLLSRGHRRIGFLVGNTANNYTAQMRLDGIIQAYKTQRLKLDNKLIVQSDYNEQMGYLAFRELWRQRPTAVFATNMHTTIGATIAIREMGMEVGKDLSLFTFDQTELTKIVSNDIAVVIQPMERIAYEAYRILLNRIRGVGEEGCIKRMLQTEIHFGSSVCDCPQ